jgi:hypothetical protein
MSIRDYIQCVLSEIDTLSHLKFEAVSGAMHVNRALPWTVKSAIALRIESKFDAELAALQARVVALNSRL